MGPPGRSVGWAECGLDAATVAWDAASRLTSTLHSAIGPRCGQTHAWRVISWSARADLETITEQDPVVIKVLMVDVDGVLVHGRPDDGRHWSTSLEDDLGVHPSDLHRVFFDVSWEDVVRGRATLRDSLTTALHRIAPSLSADRLIAYWFERDSRLDAQLLDALHAIRTTGIRVHLATNQEHERARYLMETLGLARYADAIHYSARLGARKPSREFFDAVAANVGVSPARLLLVDDRIDHVLGAKAAGWNALHWTRGPAMIETLHTTLHPFTTGS